MSQRTSPGAGASTDTDERTLTESLVEEHQCTWVGDRGRCRCGLTVTGEDEWRGHVEHVVVDNLWTPTAEFVTSETVLDQLPARSVIAVHPGRENAVFRRKVLGNPKLSAWHDFTGTFRPNPSLLPALVLERGPQILSDQKDGPVNG